MVWHRSKTKTARKDKTKTDDSDGQDLDQNYPCGKDKD